MERIELMGFDGLFEKLGDILSIRKSLYRRFAVNPPDVFIGIDVPDFNLSLESKLKKKGIKIVHYVSPTVWAWRGYRIHKIRRAVDLMLTLFPFEAEYYRRNNIAVCCVGHPIADQIEAPDRNTARESLALNLLPDELLIAILPGSRRSEIRRLANIFVDAARRLKRDNPAIKFALPFANSKVRALFEELVGDTSDLPLVIYDGQSRQVMEAADIVLLASGTAALEAALLERPHVVVYRVSLVTYCFFKALRHVKYYSMSNQLLPEAMVPELMQHDATAGNISNALQQMIDQPEQLKSMQQAFRNIRLELKQNANVQAAQAIAEVLEQRSC